VQINGGCTSSARSDFDFHFDVDFNPDLDCDFDLDFDFDLDLNFDWSVQDLKCLQLLADLVPASLLVQVAFLIAAEGRIPLLVALLLVGSKHIVNAVSRIGEPASATGTLVELLLRKALATSPGGGGDRLGPPALGPKLEREVALKALEVLLLWNPRLTSRGPEARSPEHIPVIRSARANDAEVGG
jgi:hypothetical protein